jgi:hypothetical protein
MKSIAEQLKSLNARRILIRAAEQGKITKLRCAMEECLCPRELGGRGYFESVTRDLSDWMPTNDHYPTLKCDGGQETVDNSRLAHRLCNRVDYSKRIGRSIAKDLARVEAARREGRRRRKVASIEPRQMTIAELLRFHGQTLAELRRRRVVRTANAPVGDYAEWLVAAATGGELAENAEKSWDVAVPEGKLQVKARLVGDVNNRSQRQVSVFRSWDFDAAVFVLFDQDYAIRRAACVPVEAVEAAGRFRKWVNGYVVFATDELLSQGEDWTERLKHVTTDDAGQPSEQSSITHDDRLRVEYTSTGNQMSATRRAEAGDAHAQQWLLDRRSWMAARRVMEP